MKKIFYKLQTLMLLMLSTIYVGVTHAEENTMQSVIDDKPTLVIIGASYAQDWKVKELAGYRIVNKGMTGEQTFEVLERFERDVIGEKPEIVLIWGFINDIARGQRDKVEETIESVKNNITSMVKISTDNEITPILATELTIRNQKSIKAEIKTIIGKILGKKSYQDYANENVMKINHWVKDTAEKNNIMFLDFQKLLSTDSGERKRDYAQDDGSHVTEAAYDELTKYVEESFKSMNQK